MQQPPTRIDTPAFVIVVDAEGVLVAPRARPDDFRRLSFKEVDKHFEKRWREMSFEPTATPGEPYKPIDP